MSAQPIKFFREKEKYGELSNYFVLKQPITYKGKTYQTSEHLFQALKYLHDDATKKELEYAEVIRTVNTANKARILANQDRGGGYKWRTDLNPIIDKYSDTNIKDDWDKVKRRVMKEVLHLKFKADSHCKSILLSTAPNPLIENSPFDSYWGAGKDGTGKNHLGKILVQVREELLSEKEEEVSKKRKVAEKETETGKATTLSTGKVETKKAKQKNDVNKS